MTLPVPNEGNFLPGVAAVSSFLNGNIRDAINFLINKPHAVLYQATAQSLANATPTPITFDSQLADNYAGHSTVTNPSRYTAQRAGWYVASGLVNFAPNATGWRLGNFRVNGSAYVLASQPAVMAITTAGINTAVSVGAVRVFLNVGDYIELLGNQGSGGALNTQTGGAPNDSGMSIVWDHI